MVRVDTAVCGNIYFHMMTMTEAGDVVPTHRHSYGHVLQVQKGRVRVWSEKDGDRIISAPGLFDVPAGVSHDMEALDAGTVCCCIHPLRDEHDQLMPFSYEATSRELANATGRL